MKKFEAIAATTNIDLANEQFTLNALKIFTQQTKDIPILLGFDDILPIGFVKSSYVTKNKKLFVQGIIDEKKIELCCGQKGFCVPGFIIKESFIKNNIKKIIKIEPISYGFTISPTDKTITPIAILNDDETS